MIQELLGGNRLLMDEKKPSLTPNLLLISNPSPSSCNTTNNNNTSSTPSPSTTSSPVSSASSEPQHNLRCPRCDSSNTKFCYYNNYNLTQPRHFCKTCRRYWTKGGALRNVPIGGGCRKAKPTTSTSISKSSPSNYKMRFPTTTTSLPDSTILGKLNFSGALEPSMIPWSSSPQGFNLMSLLRSTHNTTSGSLPIPLDTPNHNPSPYKIKDEAGLIGSTYVIPESSLVTNALNHQISSDLCSPVLWKNSTTSPYNQQYHQQQGVVFGQDQLEVYQKLMKSSFSSSVDQMSEEQVIASVGTSATVVGSASASGGGAGSILEPIPLASGVELGYWNSIVPLAWCDMPATNQ